MWYCLKQPSKTLIHIYIMNAGSLHWHLLKKLIPRQDKIREAVLDVSMLLLMLCIRKAFTDTIGQLGGSNSSTCKSTRRECMTTRAQWCHFYCNTNDVMYALLVQVHVCKISVSGVLNTSTGSSYLFVGTSPTNRQAEKHCTTQQAQWSGVCLISTRDCCLLL